MNWIAFLVRNRAEVIDRVADHVHDAAERAFTNRHRDRSARVGRFHPAHHAVGGQHRHRAHAAFAQVLLHFGDYIDRIGNVKTVGSNPQGLVNWGQILFGKFHVNHRSDDLHDAAYLSVGAVCAGRSHIFLVNSS